MDSENMDIDDSTVFVPQPKRFKHQSYQQTLKEVHLPSAFQQSHLEHEVGDNDSHFHEALDHWRQLNLAPSFIEFANKADGLSASMPLLLHNWREIYVLWEAALNCADDEGLRALLDLLQKMVHDLRTTVAPVYGSLLDRLLALLPRAISAAALTALLETLSSLFRYLLIPAIDNTLLAQTWERVCTVLPKCMGEIQRAVAEVWGAVLRRLKAAPREEAVRLLAANTALIEDASAWAIVYASKSVSQTLHTCTPSLYQSLISYHLSDTEDPKPTYKLIRRSLTALIHHVKGAEQFSPVGDVVMNMFITTQKAVDLSKEEDIERLSRMMEVTSVVASVRHGARLTDAQKATLFSELGVLQIIPQMHTVLLRYTLPLLMAGDMSLWLGPGLKFLQRIWNRAHIEFTLKLHLCLADAGWHGWKLVAVPVLFKSTLKPEIGLLEEAQHRVLIGFLATIMRGQKLGSVAELDLGWKRKIEGIVSARLTTGKWKEGALASALIELENLLVLVPLCSDPMAPCMIKIVQLYLESPIQEADRKEAARILSLSMHAISKRDTKEWVGQADLNTWTRKGLKNWAWSHEFVSGLVAIAQASPTAPLIPLSDIYVPLRASFLSHSRPVRLAALHLLDSKLVDPAHDQVEVLKRCLQGEEVPIDIQGVRERVLRIGRVGQVVGDEKGADLCARWLISQLKVNLRPLWSPAATALASLAQRFGDLVWRLLFEELQKMSLVETIGTSESQSSVEREQEPSGESGEDDGEDDPWEEERTWRDPSSHKLREVVILWDDPEGERKRSLKAEEAEERFDHQSYEHQLLSTLGECSALVEKHNRELVPYFLTLSGHSDVSISSSMLPKPKLLAWLTLLSKFSNPRALYCTETLRSLYVTLLSHPDRALQNMALTCLFTYKLPHLTPFEELLRALLDDTRWRDELSLFSFDTIPDASREEVIDVFIRLLFGVMLEKKGRNRGGGGGGDRRAAVLSAFTGCTDQELGLLVDLMLRPFGWNRASAVLDPQDGFRTEHIDAQISNKQLTGFLTLLGDVLKNLGSRLRTYWPALLGTTINLLSTVQTQIESTGEEKDTEGGDIPRDDDTTVEDVEVVEDSTGDDASPQASSKIARSIRQLGLKRFTDFFRVPVIFDFTPFMSAAFASFISPRLPSLDRENTQAPSALLELFYTWTIDGVHIPLLVDFDNTALPKIYDCLVSTNVKPSVISRIFDIVDNLLSCSTEDDYTRDVALKPHVSRLLTNLAVLVERTKGSATIATPIGQRQITILSEITQYSTNSEQASTLLDLFNPLLRRPAKIVPEKVKAGIVKIIGELLHLIPDMKDRESATYRKTYALLSQLFQSLRSRPSRINLVATFQHLALLDGSLAEVAALMEALNAYSARRMDEPDFDRRLIALGTLNETKHATLSCSEWLPILYNMLNFIQDPVELAIRNSASYAMRHFIDLVAAQTSPEHEDTFIKVLFPGLKNGLRSKNEQVRVEVLGVIAYSVEKCEHMPMLQEMRILLEGGDDEANFFNNILHIQVHRRSRALRRLADHCEAGHLKSTTIADIFVPLVANYIVSTTTVDHHLVTDAILATGRMSRQLSWGPYYALVQKYLKLSRTKDESERVYVRALVALLDNFHFSMEQEFAPEATTENPDEDGEDADSAEAEVAAAASVALAAQELKKLTRIADAVNLRLLPNLLNHLEKHDVTTDDNTRIPLSIGIITVAMHLPVATREGQITRLLTILSQILRSKSQETRDLVRDSLNRIAVHLGPTYLPIIFRELRAALLRGPQLHVLAYATHSLVIHITNGEHAKEFINLDNCVHDVAYVSAEVIFGESGKDVQSEDFKTKMREVKVASSRALDTFATMAKFITPSRISSLLGPIKTILHETESSKVIALVDEVLKRIATGLNGNQHLVPTELLVLCNTLISQNAKFLQQTASRRKNVVKGDAIVQMKRKVAKEADHYTNNSFRFVNFGLDLLLTALKRNRFDFKESSHIARLESMVVVIGNTLYSTNATVLTLAMRCAAGLAKCPLKAIEKSLPVVVRQILDIIKQTGNTESDLVQVAFKALATILRDGPPVQVKEKDLIYLIELLSPDLEDHARQASVFTLLRAIVARKFIVPEIYDLMEKVSEVSVTSQSPQVQELCRGVLLQFLLDYPQGKGRLRNQMAFFAKNLSYIHETGRTSIMELLGAVITKFQANLIQEYADLLFVALVMVVANDDSTKCREMAAQLIKNIWKRLDDERRDALLSHLHSWASQTAQPLLTWVSAQVCGFVVDVAKADSLPYIQLIINDLNTSLLRSSAGINAIEDAENGFDQMDVELEWQLPYHALTVLAKVLRVFPDFATQDGKIPWPSVVDHLLFPHAWVRTAACRLLGLLFSAVPASSPQPDLPSDHPLSSAGMRVVARKLTQQLKSEHLDQALGLQVVKNLFYLGKCFYLIPMSDNAAVEIDVEGILDNENEDLPENGASRPLPEDRDGLKDSTNPLPWLFSKVSYQIKSGHIARRSKAIGKPNWAQQPLAGLRWFAAMSSHMDAERLEKFLVHILTPVYRLTEDDTIRDPQMDELKTTAIELQDLAQSKVGTPKFAHIYNQIRQSVLGLRRERKVARVLQASTNPEAAARRKIQRNVIKKDSRKRKDRGFLESRGKSKRPREE